MLRSTANIMREVYRTTSSSQGELWEEYFKLYIRGCDGLVGEWHYGGSATCLFLWLPPQLREGLTVYLFMKGGQEITSVVVVFL